LIIRPDYGSETPFWSADDGTQYDDMDGMGLPLPLQWHIRQWCFDATNGEGENSLPNEGMRLLEQVKYYVGDRFEFRWDWDFPVGDPFAAW
jgi:hypothetical protein